MACTTASLYHLSSPNLKLLSKKKIKRQWSGTRLVKILLKHLLRIKKTDK